MGISNNLHSIPRRFFDSSLRSMRKLSVIVLISLSLVACLSAIAEEATSRPFPAYRSELNIIYARVGDQDLKLNAFLPENTNAPVPAMVEIHGGWWFGGE